MGGSFGSPVDPLWLTWGILGLPEEMKHHFPRKCAKITVVLFKNKAPGTLQRIYYFPADLPEMGTAAQNRPWVPHAGGQDDGSLNKLPQINIYKN